MVSMKIESERYSQFIDYSSIQFLVEFDNRINIRYDGLKIIYVDSKSLLF